MSVARNTLTQSSITMVSRVMGFVRDILIASRIGAGPIGDAYVTAVQFPNIFRRLLAEGAFSQAFIPSYAQELDAEGAEPARVLAQDAMRVLFAITLFLVIICQISMPWIMRLIHSGYAPNSEGFKLAVMLTQITMPYLACMGLVSLFSGVLNTAGRYIFSAAAPTLMNAVMIAAVFMGDDPNSTAFWVAISISIAGLVQLSLLWWGVARQGVKLRLGLPRWNDKIQALFVLAVPGMIAASSMQINIFVSQSLASWEMGAKTWIFYADRLYQLPLGLIAIPLGLAILPPLSRAVRREAEAVQAASVADTKTKQSQSLMDQGLALSLGFTMPATLALMIAPHYIVDALFVRDNFTFEDANRTATALFHFGWGLPAFVLIKVLTPAYFARKDTKTPMYFGLVSIAVNVALCVSLFYYFRSIGQMGYVGLAIATSLAAWGNVVMLWLWLVLRKWYIPSAGFLARLLRVVLASLPFALALFAVVHAATILGVTLTGFKIIDCMLFMGCAGTVYVVSAMLFGVVKLSEIRGAMAER